MLATEFVRCCKKYSVLDLAVAWCGNPKQTLPYRHLEAFNGRIIATIGRSFNHTHPDGIEWFKKIGADIRVFKDDSDLFHPKIYLFRGNDRFAAFVGSSNLTYGGFYTNIESNSLIEGTISDVKGPDIHGLLQKLKEWHSDKCSFKPTPKWLAAYRKAYRKTAAKQHKYGIRTPSHEEDKISRASWLRNADWEVYSTKVVEGLRKRQQNLKGYHDVLDAAAKQLPLPWKVNYFQDIEKRRIIGGMEPYGWLGHVAASGHFRHLLAQGSVREQNAIVGAINRIASLNHPIPWDKLKAALENLIKLGPSMKVWGRLLCLIRPDLYCTVSSLAVRNNLSRTLKIPPASFEQPSGYLQLIKLCHASPWFNSAKPRNRADAAIWSRRVAFMDAIFYEWEDD